MGDDAWATAWPGFEFGLQKSTSSTSRKISGAHVGRASHNDLPNNKDDGTTAMWTDKHCPQTEDTLAVHKKKVAEVRDWLLSAVTGVSKSPKILLLTGPVGVGKSATVRVLARELGYDITEWINPVRHSTGMVVEDERGRVQYEESAMSQFKDFVVRAQRYQPLSFGNPVAGASVRRLTVIEDLPNTVLYQPEAFHGLLRSCAANSNSPLLFIASDRADDNRILAKLFPRPLMDALRIREIKFNPVAKTALVKALSYIATAERFEISTEICSQLVEISLGDIRSAVNSLQVYCIKGVKKLVVDPINSRKRKKSKERRLQHSGETHEKFPKDFGNRGLSLDMFHALGRILNAKRGIGDKDTALMPERLASHGRLPSMTKGSVESVMEASNLPADMFTLFLHENYTSYVTQLDDLEAATEHFSDADMLMSMWQHRKLMAPTAGSTACRGFIHSNTVRSSIGFKPMHAPKCLSAEREAAQNAAKWKRTFFSDDAMQTGGTEMNLSRSASSSSLYTDMLPFMCKILHPRELSGGQKLDLAEVSSFGRAHGYTTNAAFTDRDSVRVLATVLEHGDNQEVFPVEMSSGTFSATPRSHNITVAVASSHAYSGAASSDSASRTSSERSSHAVSTCNHTVDDVEDWDSSDND